MSARIMLICERLHGDYGVCAATLLTDAQTIADARAYGARLGWYWSPQVRQDLCPTCSGRQPTRGPSVVHLRPEHDGGVQ
ncbi:hypothetical protein RM572_21795 [Streptomyces sp. DSM 42041]|uniref:Uncharacterized protein n=1 Tax=Streptomyces hazeniae TaxID=3075538 RepID=A0ABU2NWN7_9ACTN|nr:hypothetical protein [Streptomyces sp. DSM 42041]MDT0381395.1 hypothetical protein [Streptomyces sp. DSM 42041]